MKRPLALTIALLTVQAALPAQVVSREYQVKAAFLFNFAKFVEWPTRSSAAPLHICVAGVNPFHGVLDDIVRDETVGGRAIVSRVILEPDPTCHMVFIPRGANGPAYLRAASGMAILTVGETADFIEQGGLVRFYLDTGQVRFEIHRQAAERVGIRISSRLLQLARVVSGESR